MNLFKVHGKHILLVTLIVTIILLRGSRSRSIVARSSCFEHQIGHVLEVDGSRVTDLVLRGKGLYSVVVRRSMGKVYTSSFHLGVLKMHTFETRLKDMHEFIQKEKSNGSKTLVLFSLGTTHEKGVLEEIRGGLVDEEYPELAEIFRIYGMKKFLSMAHGCRQPYVLIHDLTTSETISERTGACGGTLCAKK